MRLPGSLGFKQLNGNILWVGSRAAGAAARIGSGVLGRQIQGARLEAATAGERQAGDARLLALRSMDVSSRH